MQKMYPLGIFKCAHYAPAACERNEDFISNGWITVIFPLIIAIDKKLSGVENKLLYQVFFSCACSGTSGPFICVQTTHTEISILSHWECWV